MNSKNTHFEESQLFVPWEDDSPTKEEQAEAIRLLLQHLNLQIWRTDKTKHGNVELVLRDSEGYAI